MILFEFVGILAAFSAVMLACSLLVMFAVKTLHYFGRERGRGLVAMLAEINLLFRARQGDFCRDGDRAQADFLLDVLEHRLIDPEPVRQTVPLAEREPDRSAKAALEIAQGRFAVSLSEVLSAVRELCEDSPAGPVLPERWSLRLAPSKRRFDDFEKFISGTFSVLEATSTIRFRLRAKRLSVAISALLVVILNLDTFHVGRALLKDTSLRESLHQAAPLLLEQADELGEPGDADWLGSADDQKKFISELSSDFVPLNTLLSDERLGLGWADSPIAHLLQNAPWRRPAVTYAKFLGDFALWLLGLLVSWGLVAQGPPFWADMLRRFAGRGRPAA